MRPALRWGAIIAVSTIGFAGGGLAHAPAPAGLDAGEEAFVVEPTTPDETTGSVGRAVTIRKLPLTDEENGWVFLGVINLPDVPDVDLPEVDRTAIERTEVLPASVALEELPAMVTARIPLLRDYRFVKLDDRILLVRPGDRAVVSEIPRYRLVH